MVVVDDLALRWLLTAVFAAASVYYSHGLVRRAREERGVRHVLDDALHVLMGVGMIAMAWSWGMAVPVMIYVVVFTSAALWFVSRALFAPPRYSAPAIRSMSPGATVRIMRGTTPR